MRPKQQIPSEVIIQLLFNAALNQKTPSDSPTRSADGVFVYIDCYFTSNQRMPREHYSRKEMDGTWQT